VQSRGREPISELDLRQSSTGSAFTAASIGRRVCFRAAAGQKSRNSHSKNPNTIFKSDCAGDSPR
jgi:hypothetical protein